MMATDDDVRLAYTYAWWLTGDEGTAEEAVLEALGRPDVPGADDQLRVEILLRRVRTAAVSSATMCPASELALLHDSMGLSLPSAAGLCEVDARDARTELAHGRLEALTGADLVEIVEPERLGGLAVGNPADVAAARQNAKLADLRSAILKGRDELIGLAAVPVPERLLAEARATTGAATGDAPTPDATEAEADRSVTEHLDADDPSAGDPSTGDPSADQHDPEEPEEPEPGEPDPEEPEPDETADDQTADDQAADDGTADDETAASRADLLASIPVEKPRPQPAVIEPEEVDLSEQLAPSARTTGEVLGVRSTLILWVAIGVTMIIGVLVLIFATDDTVFEEDPVLSPPTEADQPSPTPTADDGAAEDPVDDPPAEEPLGALDGLELLSFRVAIGIGADAQDGPVTASPDDPLTFEIRHRGAQTGDQLVTEWTVDGEDLFRNDEVVDLLDSTDDDRTARFSRSLPAGGWPLGQHVITLRTADGADTLGSVQVTITEDA